MESNTESDGVIAVGRTLRFSSVVKTAIHRDTALDSSGISLLANQVVLGTSRGTLYAQNGSIRIGNGNGLSVLDRDSNNASVNTRVVASGAIYESSPMIEASKGENAGKVISSGLFDRLFDRDDARSLARQVADDAESSSAIQAVPEFTNQGVTFRLKKGVVNYWQVSADQIKGIHEIQFANNSSPNVEDKTFLITVVNGQEVDLNVKVSGVDASAIQAILWDFPDAEHIVLGNKNQGNPTSSQDDTLEGSILASNAYLDKYEHNIEGTIIVKRAKLVAGEQHYYPYKGPSLDPKQERPTPPADPNSPKPVNPTEPPGNSPALPQAPETPKEMQTPKGPNDDRHDMQQEAKKTAPDSMAVSGSSAVVIAMVAVVLLVLASLIVLMLRRRRGRE